MGDTVLIETTADEVVSIVTAGPQGPSGSEAATLTTTGDLLYRDALANDRLPIGSEGQVLKVASGLPAWGNESGAVTSVNGETGTVVLNAADVGAATSAQGSLADSAVQPGDLATVATSGDYDDLTNKPSTFTPSTHASTHAAGGSDAIAPNNISAAWAQIVSSQTITTDTTLSAGRNRRITLIGTGATANVDLPSSGNEAGDIVTLVSSFFVSSVFTIRKPAGTPPFVNLATLNASGQSYTFVNVSGSSTGWALVDVDTHTHDTSDITSGTLAHERGGLEADVSAYNGLVKISGSSTSAVTVTTAGEALLDDADAAAQRTTLGLGNSATLDTGTTAGTVAEGDHTHELNALDATGATDGHVLTADGAGGAAFEALPASGIPETLLDAKGDLIVASAADTAARLAVGSNGTMLVADSGETTGVKWAAQPVEYVIACSDETSDLTTGTAKVTFRAPVAFLLTGVAASVNTAPTGSTLIVDINNGANSALSTKLSIDASEKTSATAATAAVIDATYDDFAADAEITIDIDQVGSTTAGKGLKVILKGTRA